VLGSFSPGMMPDFVQSISSLHAFHTVLWLTLTPQQLSLDLVLGYGMESSGIKPWWFVKLVVGVWPICPPVWDTFEYSKLFPIPQRSALQCKAFIPPAKMPSSTNQNSQQATPNNPQDNTGASNTGTQAASSSQTQKYAKFLSFDLYCADSSHL
jgi:hypothetical protein